MKIFQKRSSGWTISCVGLLTWVCLSSSSAFAFKSRIPTPPSTTLPKILQEIETKYSQAGTIQAQFDQITESTGLQRKKHSSGTITIKTPDKIRWETLSPDKNILVSDGKTFWFYTPPFESGENGQLIERKGKDIRSTLTSALMTGSFSAAQRNAKMKIIRNTPAEYTLLLKKGSAGTVTQAKIQIDLKEKLIKKVILNHSDGNTAEISLSQIHLGQQTADSLFTFTAPPNTDIVNE